MMQSTHFAIIPNKGTLCKYKIIEEIPETYLKKDRGNTLPEKRAPRRPCRPRYNLHLYGQVGRLQLALPLPTSNRRRQSGGLRTTG